MFHICLRRCGKWRSISLRVLVTRILETNQVTPGRWSQELSVTKCPLGAKRWFQCTEELKASQNVNIIRNK